MATKGYDRCTAGVQEENKDDERSVLFCLFLVHFQASGLIVQSKPVDCVVVSDSFLPRLDLVVGRHLPPLTKEMEIRRSTTSFIPNTMFRTSTTTGRVTTPTPPTTTSLYQHQEHRPGLSTAMIYPRCRCL